MARKKRITDSNLRAKKVAEIKSTTTKSKKVTEVFRAGNCSERSTEYIGISSGIIKKSHLRGLKKRISEDYRKHPKVENIHKRDER